MMSGMLIIIDGSMRSRDMGRKITVLEEPQKIIKKNIRA